ncbi:hypothetical protein DJ031_00180 [bacterium endosymbiont of Escarpia laminata]|nr:MAG: hypothetical protein DJ031_00180 [bacterium endosymbiont of Escarpia laminata]
MPQNFEDAPGLRAVVDTTYGPVVSRSAWEQDIERRVITSERMLGEIHAMVQALRPSPVVSAASAAMGSAAQVVSADAPEVEWRRAVPLLPTAAEPGCAVPPQPVAADAPWATVDTFFPGNVSGPLSEATQNLISSCTSTALPLDSQIPDALRAKIWAGEFIDLTLLLKPTGAQQQEYALAINKVVGNPTLCVSPAKPKDSVLTFGQWGQAFQMYMSVYLLQPANLPSAVKMLKYMEIVRGLAEEGGNWRSYDEAFRTMRHRWGWAWDSISWELWMKASQSQTGRRLSTGPPFHGQGRARPQASSPCFAFNKGEMCNSATCRYVHKCQICGGAHPVVRCFKAHGKSPRPSNPPFFSPPGGPSAASRSPSWHRR